MNESVKIDGEYESAVKKLEQYGHQVTILENRKIDQKRKARTRRLIERGAMLEKFISNADTLTNDEILSILKAHFS
jgi:thiamine kinase-like enzyme